MSAPGPSLLGVGALVFAAVTCVVLSDTAGKLLAAGGTAPVFIAWVRFALPVFVLLPFSGLTRAELPRYLDRFVILRALCIAAAVACILTALRTEPIANVFGAFFIGPILSYALAVAFLGETPSKLRAILLALGFAGVVLVVKPGFGATIGMAFAVAAGLFYGAYLATTRFVATRFRALPLMVSQLVIGAIALTPLAWMAGAPEPAVDTAVLLVASAAGSMAGNLMLINAHRHAEASLVAPLVYTQLFSATLVGVAVFGEWPDALALIGLAIIAASGLGSLVLARRAA
ncbi:MAG: DMT family transporter [Pseudomonadota bacterium]